MPEPKIVEKEVPEDSSQDYAFLGREFMTWLVFRASRGETSFEDDAGEFQIGFGSRLRLVSPESDAVVKGRAPAAGVLAHAAIGAGSTVREAELSVARGDREFRFTLVGETLDLKSVKLPSPRATGGGGGVWNGGALGRSEDAATRPPKGARVEDSRDDRLADRMALLEELESCIAASFQVFVRERTRPVWQRSIVPEMRVWLARALEVD